MSKELKIFVFSKDDCQFCQTAKDFLSKNNYKYEECNISKVSSHMDDLMKRMKSLNFNSQITFPQIFVDGKLIGGCDELIALSFELGESFIEKFAKVI